MQTGTTTHTERGLTRKEAKDLKVLALFTSVYCHAHHDGEKRRFDAEALDLPDLGVRRRTFCDECRDFLAYALTRRIKCPLDPKPTCKHCHIHCYRDGHREKVREIMRFSGQRLIRRGRLDLLWHYLF
ncbi:MAG: nitrous oxide-stimulated promoter family protein [Desulfuromonadales bacterium]|nr:nitrous oxide-stimulated promoter family protein [Desulfuromonadales bacterium]NIR34354.1 nitrous oxide-stimulated promoter family protein [Desulfuromonadales bacterium]NIS40414.1 nitrous oxide-stimulated promoter family protein [Desulfuromonadales bacterium]